MKTTTKRKNARKEK